MMNRREKRFLVDSGQGRRIVWEKRCRRREAELLFLKRAANFTVVTLREIGGETLAMSLGCRAYTHGYGLPKLR